MGAFGAGRATPARANRPTLAIKATGPEQSGARASAGTCPWREREGARPDVRAQVGRTHGGSAPFSLRA
eukprot:11163416-Lingulodinium_polyedra.AAC.1